MVELPEPGDHQPIFLWQMGFLNKIGVEVSCSTVSDQIVQECQLLLVADLGLDDLGPKGPQLSVRLGRIVLRSYKDSAAHTRAGHSLTLLETKAAPYSIEEQGASQFFPVSQDSLSMFAIQSEIRLRLEDSLEILPVEHGPQEVKTKSRTDVEIGRGSCCVSSEKRMAQFARRSIQSHPTPNLEERDAWR
jgi:hypothetical protein